MLFPENEIQLSQVLKHCYHRNLAIVPQSGNTGLVGGGLALFDEIILSMKKFNKNYKLDTFSGVVICIILIGLTRIKNYEKRDMRNNVDV